MCSLHGTRHSHLYQWLDRRLALQFIRGFNITGFVESSHLFRELGLVAEADQKHSDELLGDKAIELVDELERTSYPMENANIINERVN